MGELDKVLQNHTNEKEQEVLVEEKIDNSESDGSIEAGDASSFDSDMKSCKECS